ncbi:unnamed protein product [Spirodela intermedia]|uniref:Uncharacterized protein n=1 Tax=Spirodela intermedia TaxID=51605 RepID=A0A7I8ITC4_SPIIN|nr:unnamed protein product [Spirodela intermedia]CAA6661045.1 unnamed protein product [Spirodela intermedia]
MVKLATTRESRMYGTRLVRNRWNARSGLVVLLIGLAIVAAVNGHDLVAHLAGIDYLLSLLLLDSQLALVEVAVPLLQMLGSAVTFVGILLLFIQRERGYSQRMEKQAVNTLVAGPALWLLGSIHNLCQVYERADGHVQILQKFVQIPFLMGSLLFLVGGVFNSREITVSPIPGESWAWLSLSGSLFFLLGGLFNVVKVFKMQQMDGIRLEKLRGGAQERLITEREGQVPLILEEARRQRGEERRRRHLPLHPTRTSSSVDHERHPISEYSILFPPLMVFRSLSFFNITSHL